jgi:hypothetical protein
MSGHQAPWFARRPDPAAGILPFWARVRAASWKKSESDDRICLGFTPVMVESDNACQIKSNRRKKMTNSNNIQAVAVKTRVNAGGGGVVYKSGGINHNETVAVITRVNAGEFLHPDVR